MNSTDPSTSQRAYNETLGNVLKRVAIKAAIFAACFAYIFTIITCNPPGKNAIAEVLSTPVKTFSRNFDLGQNWSMFAPEPCTIIIFVRAEVKYNNGETKFWDLPRPEKMSFVTKMFKERYRKWAADNMRNDDHKFMWEPAARYVARVSPQTASVYPVEVSLWRIWTNIEKPKEINGKPDLFPIGMREKDPTKQYSDKGMQQVKFFTLKITPADLQNEQLDQ
jgi:hypothetical protein